MLHKEAFLGESSYIYNLKNYHRRKSHTHTHRENIFYA